MGKKKKRASAFYYTGPVLEGISTSYRQTEKNIARKIALISHPPPKKKKSWCIPNKDFMITKERCHDADVVALAAVEKRRAYTLFVINS